MRYISAAAISACKLEMATNIMNFFRCLFFVQLSILALKSTAQEQADIKRSDFPHGFLFGAGTSAYQIEGGFLEDGKSLSTWDVFSHIKGAISNGENGDVADDHYHRYMEDIELMHSLGLAAYRFSISWSRVLPRGKLGGVNQAGITFYNKIIDNLRLRGIEPFVTIHHFDYPQELEDRFGAWLSPLMQEEFLYLAEICFENFADRVKYWVTVNEPNIFADASYIKGMFPPGRCSPPFGNCTAGNSDIEPLIVVHNMLLAHAKAVKLYREQFKWKVNGTIGMTVHGFMYIPMSEQEEDMEATRRALAFNIAWVLDPVVIGDYPPEMKRYHGSELPKFSSEERLLLRDSIDFIGLNHYGSQYAKDCIHSVCICKEDSCNAGGDRAIRGFVLTTGERDGVKIGEPTASKIIFSVPEGMEGIVLYLKERYSNKPMIITENGYPAPANGVDNSLHDTKRVNYHQAYLRYLAQAIRKGADVRGYYIWSLMDNFEWYNGYNIEFGLYSIDRQTLHRIPRLSATWYRDFLSNSGSTDAVKLLSMKVEASVLPLERLEVS